MGNNVVVLEKPLSKVVVGGPSFSTAAWSDIQGKPDTFPPSAHNHDTEYDALGAATTAQAAAIAASAPVSHVGSGGSEHANAVAEGASGFMTGADKSKLDSIAPSANNYTHPANHSPSIITQDANNRFVSDTEKAAWNGKATPADITAAITAAINGLVDASPGTLDTLNELAEALGDDPNFATTMTNALAAKANVSSLGSMAGQNATAVNIDGGSVNGATIGLDTPALGKFTDVEVLFSLRSGQANSTPDWNTALKTGTYMGSGTQNAPLNDPAWFIGNVVQHNDDWVTQEVWSFVNGVETPKFRRQRTSGIWGPWISQGTWHTNGLDVPGGIQAASGIKSLWNGMQYSMSFTMTDGYSPEHTYYRWTGTVADYWSTRIKVDDRYRIQTADVTGYGAHAYSDTITVDGGGLSVKPAGISGYLQLVKGWGGGNYGMLTLTGNKNISNDLAIFGGDDGDPLALYVMAKPGGAVVSRVGNENVTTTNTDGFHVNGKPVTAPRGKLGLSVLGNDFYSGTELITYKIASLPVSTAGTHDHIAIEGVCGGWSSDNKYPFRLIASNRDSLRVNYEIGATVGAGIDFYTEADGSISIWARVDGSFRALSYSIASAHACTTYTVPIQGNPTGVLAWSMATAQPSMTQSFAGMGFNKRIALPYGSYADQSLVIGDNQYGAYVAGGSLHLKSGGYIVADNYLSAAGYHFHEGIQSADPRVLDEYEEGTWTPVLTGTGGGSYPAGGLNAGRYVRIGQQVTLVCTIQWTSTETPYVGNLIVAGMPFPCTGIRAAGCIGPNPASVILDAGFTQLIPLVDPYQVFMYLVQQNPQGNYSHTPSLGIGGIIYSITMTYITDQ